jgi:CO dehydrogenase/acetyl-CoA synthase gamma subunit (corrinoid Fe-S protein)
LYGFIVRLYDNNSLGGNVASAYVYLDTIDFLRYFRRTDCTQCGIESCEEFIDALKKNLKKPQDCPFLNKNEAHAFEVALKAKDMWPEVPLLTHPRPSLVGLVEINNPHADSLVFISGNNDYTEQVFLTVLGTTTSPFFVIFVDTDGSTVDMAMIYQTLTAARIAKALKDTGIEQKASKREMIIPGFASSIKAEIEELTGWQVQIGPTCVAELPLFLSEIWTPPEK